MKWKEFLKPTLSKMLLPIISIIYPLVYGLSSVDSFLYNSHLYYYFSSNSLFFFPWLAFIFASNINSQLPYYAGAVFLLLVNAAFWYLISSWIIVQKKINSNLGKFFLFLIVFVLSFVLSTYGIITIV